jgi:hypothetical protein
MLLRDYTFLGTTRSLCPHCRRLIRDHGCGMMVVNELVLAKMNAASSEQFPVADQSFANRNPIRVINCQYNDRRPANRRFAEEYRALPYEMIFPRVAPGMEQSRQFARFGVDPGDVGPFV